MQSDWVLHPPFEQSLQGASSDLTLAGSLPQNGNGPMAAMGWTAVTDVTTTTSIAASIFRNHCMIGL